MKKNILYKGLSSILIAGSIVSLTSCKDDYLDLAPITDYTPETISSSLTGANAAMVGLCNAMYRDCDYGFNGPNGEPWLLSFYAEAPGNSCIQGLWTLSSMGVNYINWRYMNSAASGYGAYMWRYAYNLIDDANNILAIIDDILDEETASAADYAERDFIKAVALTIRSHAYIRLLQTYGPRWEDSNNGDTYCVIIRTQPSNQDNVDVDFSTMSQVLNQIYGDLSSAIDLFENSDYSRDGVWMPNEDVARGLYARAAMLENDYQTAIDMATAAMANYPIMSADEYRSGFVYANDEYLWATVLETEDVGQYSWGNWNAFNGYYTGRFGLGDSMDYRLYQNLSMTDCRKLLYFMPELIELTPMLSNYFGITPEDFFYNTTNGGKVSTNPYSAIMMYGQGNLIPRNYAYNYAWGTFEDYGESALSYYDPELTPQSYYIQPRFGLSFKFFGAGLEAYNQYPFMRASEMGYIIAEAQYMLGNISDAQSMMNYLNKDVRDPNYNCTLTGQALLDHIKAYREIELWDEGHNWFDLKRWGDDFTRTQWVEGNENSGNWGPRAIVNYNANYDGGWRYQVPESEFLYNKGADPMKVQY